MNNQAPKPHGSRFDPVADFYDSKQHTLTQLAQRISELALSDDDKSLLSRLTHDQIQNLREGAEECCAALSDLESEFVAACEGAAGTNENEDSDCDDEDDVEPARRDMAAGFGERESAGAWSLLDSYGPKLIPSGKDVEASRRAQKLISRCPRLAGSMRGDSLRLSMNSQTPRWSRVMWCRQGRVGILSTDGLYTMGRLSTPRCPMRTTSISPGWSSLAESQSPCLTA